ncbi:tetratricopeptide repeat protein [Cellulomonas sp. NS3]|uniref:tetratricopeptide repeat protein n=1 Tax=Cellulomonas sp. NS3 TaxID=2973977 RepID=UPI002161641F|nr:hypothetical protein [Cellulomonas sp. NS3]
MRSDRVGGDRPGRPRGERPGAARPWSRGDESSSRFGDDDRRPTRPPQPERVAAPELPEDIAFSDLDRAVRARLRTLSKENAENVGLHLVMTGRLLDSDPELAYEHAQAAVRRAGRVDVVREAAGLAAYRTGRFAEALRELRTVRRLNGSSEHLAVMADCERGLGRPERALTLASSPEAEGLAPAESVELAIVVSGARLDLGEPEAAIAVLRAPAVQHAAGVVAVRVAQALAAAYEAAGRADEARDALAGYTQSQLDEASGTAEEEDDVVVFDLDEDEQVPDGEEHDTATDAVSDPGAASPGAGPGETAGSEAGSDDGGDPQGAGEADAGGDPQGAGEADDGGDPQGAGEADDGGDPQGLGESGGVGEADGAGEAYGAGPGEREGAGQDEREGDA